MRRLVWVGIMVLSVASCGLLPNSDTSFFQMEYVSIVAEQDANSQSPTAVDMVIVYNPDAINSLQNATAADWFDRKRQFQLDFPDGLAVQSWEVVPYSFVPTWEIPESFMENRSGDDAVAAFVFADYLSPGAHRARLETQTGIRIHLLRDDFNLTPFDPESFTGS